MVDARCFAIDSHAKTDRLANGMCAENDVKVTGMKPVFYAAGTCAQRSKLSANFPFAAETPMIKGQLIGSDILAENVFPHTAKRGEILCPGISEIGFGCA